MGEKIRRIYVTEEAYKRLIIYSLETLGSLRGISKLASELIIEGIERRQAGRKQGEKR